jgi:transcription elongation factor Elf1
MGRRKTMKSEEEIRRVLQAVEKQIRCERCGAVCEDDVDGVLYCVKCEHLCVGTLTEFGIYKALKWVLSEDDGLSWFEK